MYKYILIVLSFAGLALSQTEEPSTTLPPFPEELQLDGEQAQDVKNKSVQVFWEKCARNGGVNAFANAQEAFQTFTTCLTSLVDKDVLQQEIEQAKPNGQVDEVFKKYCAKSPQFKGCFFNITEQVKPCFSQSEQKNLKTVHNISEQLAEFICHKEGDRIALFISENGPECIESKREELQACANKTVALNGNLDINNITADELPEFSFGEESCHKMTELQHCVVASLEKCEQPTSANIVEALFKFIRKATPCKDFEKAEQTNQPGSGSGLFVSTASLLVTAAGLLYSNF